MDAIDRVRELINDGYTCIEHPQFGHSSRIVYVFTKGSARVVITLNYIESTGY